MIICLTFHVSTYLQWILIGSNNRTAMLLQVYLGLPLSRRFSSHDTIQSTTHKALMEGLLYFSLILVYIFLDVNNRSRISFNLRFSLFGICIYVMLTSQHYSMAILVLCLIILPTFQYTGRLITQR